MRTKSGAASHRCASSTRRDTITSARRSAGYLRDASNPLTTNGVIAGLLRDLAAVQTSRQKKWAYARAAEAIAALPVPIEAYLQPDGTLRKIPNVGPSSTRIIL